ncbi:extensin family protein [Notoacmeibacter sp. MSK16QG-6]|uniref:extensin-like domain-containing protein n=1 Tax=Notoacmeibacter sp. MSK16QG-6 TaxID=2957982 RepID=UPI00209D34D5|nr:extensin family protein [Notoacmeibacter sp. MSK16QG-6]MCP1199912.1 extensin family protein [Notoacmeibacter sp. MSK16QG-6]
MIMLRALAIGICFIAVGTLAYPPMLFAQQSSEPGDINPPLPEPRPTEEPAKAEKPDAASAEASQDVPTENEVDGEDAEPPLPQSRPDDAPESSAQGAEADKASNDEDGTADDDAEKSPAALAPPTKTVPEGMSAAEITRCEKDLKALDVTFEVLDPIAGENGCGVARPYNVTEIDGVKIQPKTQMTCDAALALTRWLRGVVQPSAASFGPDVRLTEITHASTYVCRRRNNLPTGKLSEHAKGQAIDIVRFAFEGHKPLPIRPRAGKGTIEEAFQRTVQAGGCLHFTTVLGPGSDEYHNDHLHFDVIARRSGYRLCQ